ncbi:MAG: 2Fe-2S iron-sulfur cluster-binding protein [Candidatus Firestonebacteria bacterium]
MIKLTIDNKEVEVEEGTSILNAAHKVGIKIPTLCHHPAIVPYSACRVCIVELKKKSWSDLVTSCSRHVENNMIIETKSEKVISARRLVIEFILARASSSPEIIALAKEYGIEKPRFTIQEEKCILCGLCVRVCSELINVSAIGFSNRGVHREASTPFCKQSETCIGCGACVNVCPTNAIVMQKNGDDVIFDKWKTRVKLVKCKMCDNKFSSLMQLNIVKQKVNLTNEILDICPDCRRKTTVINVTSIT